MSGTSRRQRPSSTRARTAPRDHRVNRNTRTPQTPRSGAPGHARTSSRRIQPADVDVGGSGSSTSNLFTRPTTPSHTPTAPNGHAKQPSVGAMSAVEDLADFDLTRPTFQFKIGMRVGVALGECFLQVQRLESSVLQIHQISDEIRDFMNFLQDSLNVPSDISMRAATGGASGSIPRVTHKHVLSAGSNDMKQWQNIHRIRNHRQSHSSDDVDTMFGFESLRGRNRSMSTDHQPDKETRSRKTRANGNRSASPPREGLPASPIPEDAERADTISPFQQVITLNQTLERSQMDCSKRMTSVLKGLKQLQIRLEEMDDVNTKLERSSIASSDRADVHQLRAELEKSRSESIKLRRQADESRRKFEETKAILETREAQLDNDAEAIERQSEHLRADTERLLKEKEDVRRQKDNWSALIEEQKELKEQLNRREQELNESQKQLIALQNTLAQKEAHLHRKAKKLRGRERRINQSLMSLRPSGGSSYGGSDYAPSEASSKLTYFSDGDTEIASVNSLSDDDMDSRYGGR